MPHQRFLWCFFCCCCNFCKDNKYIQTPFAPHTQHTQHNMTIDLNIDSLLTNFQIFVFFTLKQTEICLHRTVAIVIVCVRVCGWWSGSLTDKYNRNSASFIYFHYQTETNAFICQTIIIIINSNWNDKLKTSDDLHNFLLLLSSRSGQTVSVHKSIAKMQLSTCNAK